MTDDADGPDFGPSGYLPERASRRARKIVLRAPLGLQWVWASVAAGLLVLVAGLLFLSRADDAPQPPFEPVAPLEAVGEAVLDDTGTVLYVTVAGRPRAFDVAGLTPAPSYCPASRLLEAADGRAWTLTGRGLDGTPSLDEHPTIVSDGVLYVDRSTTVGGPPPSSEPATTACAG